MRVLLDACVLYPTVMRELIMGAAARGLFRPLWSSRILEEWARAVAKNLPDQTEIARVEIALLKARWPDALQPEAPELNTQLYLPDPDDTHVLAAAITGRADILLTQNAKDFPGSILAGHTILRRDADGFLFDLWQDHPDEIRAVCDGVRDQAETLSGVEQPMRKLLKKAHLPRLGKALA